MNIDLSTQRIAVTGGAGFLGQAVVRGLQKRGCASIGVPRSRDYDLRTESGVQRFYDDFRPDVVLHLAASVGGIGINARRPGSFFYDNAMMGLQLMEVGRRTGLSKFVAVGSVCAYPKFAAVPFQESELWSGYPEETNAPYGIAKKMMLVQQQGYRAEFGFNAVHLVMVNLYGPGDDFSFETSHAIPAIMRRCIEAKSEDQASITLWGDGSPTREFLYVNDAAEALLLAAECYNEDEPVNIGTGQEISIRDVAERIKAVVGYAGTIEWDASKPNGQPRRCLDVSRARDHFGFEAGTALDDGLRKTFEWYESSRLVTAV